MNWRPWIILALLLVVGVVNSALMYFEEVAGPEATVEAIDDVRDRLAANPFTAGSRLTNFHDFGLPSDVADAALDEAQRVWERRDRLRELLRESAGDVGSALCPGGLPQRYAALAFLVEERDGARVVVDYRRVTHFERQDWFGQEVTDVYREADLTEEARDAATAMGVSAILLGREADVLGGSSPWGRGLGARWSIDRVLSTYPEARRMLIQYFAFMHVLTELANDRERGICG